MTMGNFYWTNFDSIWNHFDSVLANWDHMVAKSQTKLACLPNYPHSDCWMGEDGKELWLRFALAGYSKDNIKVTASKNSLRIKAIGEREENIKFVHHGISKKDVDFTLNIDEGFNVTKAETDFVSGLLTIRIPRAADSEIVELF